MADRRSIFLRSTTNFELSSLFVGGKCHQARAPPRRCYATCTSSSCLLHPHQQRQHKQNQPKCLLPSSLYDYYYQPDCRRRLLTTDKDTHSKLNCESKPLSTSSPPPLSSPPQKVENDDDDDDAAAAVAPSQPLLGLSDIPGTQKGGRKLAIVFTCAVCETRSAKQFTEQAYLRGVVIVRCPGCQNLHLIADRLGYFDNEEEWDLERIAAQRGESLKTVTDVLELDLEDIVGEEKMKELLRAAEEKEHGKKETS